MLALVSHKNLLKGAYFSALLSLSYFSCPVQVISLSGCCHTCYRIHPDTKACNKCRLVTPSFQKIKHRSQYPYTDVAWLVFLITFQLYVDMNLATILMFPATSSIYHTPAVDIQKWYTRYRGKHQFYRDSSCVWNCFPTHFFIILYMINILYSRAIFSEQLFEILDTYDYHFTPWLFGTTYISTLK